MADNKEEQIAQIRQRIEVYSDNKVKINRMRQEVEEAHYKKVKRIERYLDYESLSRQEKLEYVEKGQAENRRFLKMNDEYDEALRMIDKEIDEHEEMIRELEKQEEDENDEERENRDSE